MVEMVGFDLAYWHWLILGMAFIVLEIFTAGFIMLWFGLGAIIVGILLWFFPEMVLNQQLMVWIIASVAFAIFWFKYFKPKMVDKTKAGIVREAAIGESGRVIRAPAEGRRGIVRFSIPILGDDEWEFISENSVAIGDKVFIKEFSGNTLIVSKESQLGSIKNQ